jgi:hypothetical protein
VSGLDLKTLGKILAVAGSTDQEGEALAAVRKATAMLRKARCTWADLLAPRDEVRVATEAAESLLAEVVALKDRCQRLEAELGQLRVAPCKSVAVWSNVKEPKIRRKARWTLERHRNGQVWLSDFEVGFLETCAEWEGPRLTERMKPILRQILEKIERRTGLTPPV